MQLSFVVRPVPANCDNALWVEIFSKNCIHLFVIIGSIFPINVQSSNQMYMLYEFSTTTEDSLESNKEFKCILSIVKVCGILFPVILFIGKNACFWFFFFIPCLPVFFLPLGSSYWSHIFP